MRSNVLRLVLVLLAVSIAGCSFLLDFDPEGQPCDVDGGCLTGYACVDATCQRTDAGTDPSTVSCADAGAAACTAIEGPGSADR